MSKIVLEDFNEGNGYYKVNLAYLNKEQVEEIENLVAKWKPTDEDIKSCIGMCLTDASEQRFKDYGTNLKDCLTWLEKQGNSADKIESKFKVGDWIVFNGLTLYVKEVVNGYYITVSKDGIPNSYDWSIDNLARLWTPQDAKEGEDLTDLYYKEFVKKPEPVPPGVAYKSPQCYTDVMITPNTNSGTSTLKAEG